MKKKEVIAEIAFLGIPPDQQVEGELELGKGFTMIPVIQGNTQLFTSRLLKEFLEHTLSDLHDDDEVTSEIFDRLEEKLGTYRDDIMEESNFETVRREVEVEFGDKIAHLQILRQK